MTFFVFNVCLTFILYAAGYALVTLTHTQLLAYVYSVRTKEFGGWISKLNCHPERSVSVTDARTFLQFFFNYSSGTDVDTMIGWGHPDLIHLLKFGPCPIFADCTFSVVPQYFRFRT